MSLECLKLVGITESSETKIAIVEDDQGKIYRLKNGDTIGENHGMIVSINVTDITIIQLVQDENGDWKEKYVTFAME
jgi:type IV pilus assembly protein PilP